VSPAFTGSSSVMSIALESNAVAAGTNVVVTGWGTTTVRLCITYCLVQQLIFQNSTIKISTLSINQHHNCFLNKAVFIIKMYIKFCVTSSEKCL